MKKFTSLLTAITVSFPLMSVSQIRQGKTDRSILNIKNRSLFRYFLLSIIFVLTSGNVAWGQPWTYDYGTGTGSFSTSNTASTTLFTSTPSGGGTYRVKCGNAVQGSGFILANPGTTLGTATELQINAASSASANKYGVYSWTSPSTVAYVKCKFRTTSTGNGSLNFSLGISTLASDNNNYSNQYNNSLASFTIAYTTGAISSVVRRISGSNTTIASHGFLKGTDQIIEIYGNNGASSANYIRSGTSYSLATKTWDLWVDGTKVVTNAATAGSLAAGTNLSGFGFFGESSTSNVAYIYLDDLEYSNALPSVTVPTLTTPTATSIATTSATLGATVTANGGASLTSRGTVWGTSAAPTTNLLAEGGTAVSAFSHSRTGFTANTLYYYRGYAVNSAGTGYSPDGTFTTLHNAPNVGSGSGAATTSIVANWTAPSSGGAATFTYEVQVDNNSDFSSPEYTQNSISSATLSATATGLTPNTTYYYRVRANNAGGSSAWSSTSAGYATLPAASPTITVGSVTAFADQCINSTSSEKTYNVSGASLTANISITAPTGYQISTTSGSGFGSSVSLTQSGGTVASTPIYVRFTPTLAQAYSGNITHTSTGATQQDVAVSGNGISTAPAVTTVTATAITTTTASSGGNTVSAGCGTITAKGVVWGTSANPTVPSGNSTNNGTGTADYTSSITGLSANTTYNYRAYATNSNGVTSYGTNLTFTTYKIEPTNQATSFAVGAVTTSAIPLTWTAAVAGSQSPDGYMVKLSTGAVADPVDGTDPADVTAVTGGVANKKVTPGSATSTTSFTSMTAGTMYNYKIYSYTNSGTSINFNTTSAPSLNYATLPNASTSPTFTVTGTQTADLSWAAASGYSAANHTTLVFVKATSSITVGTPTNAPTSYTANSDFSGAGTAYQGDASAKCVYKGDGTNISITGLTANTAYYVLILNVVDASNSNSTNSYSASATVNGTTLKNAPTTQASAITFSAVGTTSMTVNWTNGNGDGRVVLISTSNSFTNPVDGTPQTGNAAYTTSGQCVYSGTGNSVTVTGLSQSTIYWFRVYEYNNSSTNIKYYTATATNNPNSQQTLAGPCISEGFNAGTSAPSGWTFTAIGGTYTTATNYGAASPSLQMDNTNDAVTTSTVGEANQLQFWIKGQGATGSYLLVEGYNGSSWSTVENILLTSITTGTTKTYNSGTSPALASGLSQFRFTYTKSVGNLALDDVEVTCVSGPTVTVSTSSITGLNYNINNGPSAAQTFNVSGSGLTDNITITPPANFELSTDGTTYNGIITLTQSGGTVSSTTIYVRLIEEMPLGSYSGSISLASTGATTKTVSLTGAVVLGAPTANEETSVTASSFQANWNTVAGATGYLVNVYTKSGGTVTDLLISEYLEGSLNNKYIEIYNGTSSSITLSNYRIDLYSNGATTATASLTLPATSLASGNTYVIGNTDGTIYTPNLTNLTVAAFNGDDALVLYKISSGQNIDIFGNIGEDPGTAWTSGSFTTVNKTLVRKSSVAGGVTTDPTTGFPTLDTEWDMYNQDVVSNLGSHTISGSGEVPIANSPFTVSDGAINSLIITGLTASTQYYYTVQALYGTDESAESNEIAVTTSSSSSNPTLSVAEVSVPDMNTTIGVPVNETIHVSGLNLTANVSLTLSGTNSGYFSVLPTSITPSSGTVTDVEVTIQYSGEATGTHTATLTVASTGATSIVLPLTGFTAADNKISIGSVNENGTWNMNFNTAGDLKVYRATALNYADSVFFSKYLEAEGNNKLIEIFNGTLNDVDLTGWKIQVRQIGSSGGAHTWSDGTVYDYNLSGTLAKGTAKVFYTKDAATTCSESFDPTWTNCTTPVLQFNGNDPIRLVDNNGHVIDLFGQTSGTFPITNGANTEGWKTTGLPENFNTMRKLLLRKTTVKAGGNAVKSNITSFATLATEWDLYPMDYSVSVISCEALQEFGSFDYNANYSTWAQLTGVVGGTNNKTIDVSGVTSPSTIANCELLKVVTDNAGTITATDFIRKPIYVSSTSSVSSAVGALTDDVCEECDIAVTNNSQLNATTETKKFKNATVFTGSKLNVSSTSDIEVNDLILKAGYSGNVYNTFPTSTMKVDASGGMKINGTLKYARTIDASQWYFISFPYDVRISDISTLNPSLGTYNTDWFIKYWDGASRAQSRSTTGNWKRYIPGDAVYEANSGYLKANVGYIIGLATGTFEVHFPLVTNSTIDAESTQTIHVTAYKNSDNISNPDHDGWNLIGLPYLSKFDGEGAAIMHYLLSDGGSSKTYTFFEPNELTGANSLNPFISYYIQTGATTDISFALTSRALAPSVIKQTQSRDKVRIYYNSTTGTDYMNLVLDDAEDGNYKIGADLVKWIGTGTAKPQVYMTQNGVNVAVNALNYAIAQNIPVTVYNKTAGSVTFSADATSATGLLSLILSDNVTDANTNLLTSDYTYTADAGTVSNRFTLSAQRIITAEKPLLESDVRIIYNNGVIRINNIPTNSKVEVFDTVGRMITSVNSNNNTAAFSSISKGVYIIQIITEGKRNSYKIIL